MHANQKELKKKLFYFYSAHHKICFYEDLNVLLNAQKKTVFQLKQTDRYLKYYSFYIKISRQANKIQLLIKCIFKSTSDVRSGLYLYVWEVYSECTAVCQLKEKSTPFPFPSRATQFESISLQNTNAKWAWT